MKNYLNNRMDGRFPVGSLIMAIAIVFSGCDFFEMPSQRKAKEASVKQAVLQREKEQEDATLQQKVKGECASLEHFIATQLKMLEADGKRNAQALDAVVADRRKFSMRVGELSEKSLADKQGTRAKGLLMLLNDDEVNQLAAKYLNSDFALLRSEFVEKVRHALEREREHKAALDRNNAKYDELMKSDQRQREQRRRSAQDMDAKRKSEIRELESKIRRLNNRMSMAEPTARRVLKKELEMAQRRLDRLQSSTQDDKKSFETRNIDSGAEDMRQRIERERQVANSKTEKLFSGEVTAFQLAEEYENLTVKRLDDAMKRKEQETRDGQERTSGRILFLKSVSSGLDRLDMAGLKKVRTDIDRKLSDATGTEEKKADDVKRK